MVITDGLAKGDITHYQMGGIWVQVRACKWSSGERSGGVVIWSSLETEEPFNWTDKTISERRLPIGYSADRFLYAVARCWWEAKDELFRRRPIVALYKQIEKSGLSHDQLAEMVKKGEDIGVTADYHDMTPTDISHWKIALSQMPSAVAEK